MTPFEFQAAEVAMIEKDRELRRQQYSRLSPDLAEAAKAALTLPTLLVPPHVERFLREATVKLGCYLIKNSGVFSEILSLPEPDAIATLLSLEAELGCDPTDPEWIGTLPAEMQMWLSLPSTPEQDRKIRRDARQLLLLANWQSQTLPN